MSKDVRPAYLYYRDWAEQLLKLPENLRLRIDDAVKRYVLYGEEPTDNEVLYSMFNLMRSQIDRDEEKYRDKCLKNAGNIQKRWQRNNDTTEYDRIRMIRPNTNDTNKDKDIKQIQDKKRNTKEKRTEQTPPASLVVGNGANKSRRVATFVAPCVCEVREYAKESHLDHVDAEAFVDYFTSVGWKVGTGKPMRDWRAAVRNWNRRNDNDPATPKLRGAPSTSAGLPPLKETRYNFD